MDSLLEGRKARALDRIADALEGILCELKKSNKIKLRGMLIDVPPDMEASKHTVAQTEKEAQDAEG